MCVYCLFDRFFECYVCDGLFVRVLIVCFCMCVCLCIVFFVRLIVVCLVVSVFVCVLFGIRMLLRLCASLSDELSSNLCV